MALKRLRNLWLPVTLAATVPACLLPTRPWPPDASRDVEDVHRVRPNEGMLDVPIVDAIDAGNDTAPDVATTGPVVRFDLAPADGPIAFGSVPFPSDLYRDANGHLALSRLPVGPAALAGSVQLFNQSLSLLDGFSVSAAAFFAIDGASLDPASLATSVHLYELTSCAEVPVRTMWRPDGRYIVAVPAAGHVLRERTAYGYVVTDGLRTDTGDPVAASPAYLSLRDASAPPASGPARVAYDGSEASIRCAGMSASPIARANILAATRFDTMNVRGAMRSIHDRIFGTTAPRPTPVHVVPPAQLDTFLGTPRAASDGMIHNGGDNPGGVVHSHIAYLVHGQFGETSWIASAPFRKGAFAYDAGGVPMVKGTIPVRFTIALPVTSGGGFANLPVMVYSHGFTTTRASMFDVADAYCAQGFAVIGIDLPFHGERNAASHDDSNNITDAPGMDFIGESVGAGAAVDFFDLNGDSTSNVEPLDPTVMRDTLRQSIADIMQEVRMVRDGDWSMIRSADAGLSTLSFDRNHIALTGNSFGAFMMGSVQPMTSEAGLVLMTVPAAGLVTPTLVDSATFQPALAPFVIGAYDLTSETDVDANNFLQSPDDSPRHPRWSPMWNLFQTLLDPGDALAYAPYMFDPANSTHPAAVVVVEAYADEVVPNQATEPYAAALGLPYVNLAHPMPPPGAHYAMFDTVSPPVAANLPSGATGGWVQFAPANHGIASTRHQIREYMIPSPPLVPLATPVAVTNEVDAVVTMLSGTAGSWVRTGTATITDPYP